MSSPIYRRAVKFYEADVGDELVALDPDAGLCLGFNDVATHVWRRLAEPATLEEIRDSLLADYEVTEEQCGAEVQELLDDMADKGLVERISR